MAQVQVNIDGKLYRMACDDGQEEHLRQLADKLNGKVSEMKVAFGEIGDMRLTVMAALTIADELAEANERLAHMESEIARLSAAHETVTMSKSSREAELARMVGGLAERIERLAATL